MSHRSHRSVSLVHTPGTRARRLPLAVIVLMSLLVSLAPAAASEASPAESKVAADSNQKPELATSSPKGILPPKGPGVALEGNAAKIIGAPPATVPTGWKAGQEQVDKRTATTKSFTGRTPGETETRVYPEPVHFKEDGKWTSIDSNLTASVAGKRTAKANSFDLELADSADNPELAKLSIDAEHSVSFGMDKAAKVIAKAGNNELTYAKTHKDTDVRLTSTRSGVKEELILVSAAAPDRFVFPLRLKGLTASIDVGGNVIYKDVAGVEQARTPHGYMFDSKVDPLSDEPARSTGVNFALIPHGSGTALEVTLDRSWLNSPARGFPITVDPEIQTRGAWSDDTYVMSPFINNYSSDTELKVGSWNGGANKARSFMHFDTGNLPAGITYAQLQMRESHSYHCATDPQKIHRVTGGWAGSTLTSYPGATIDGWVTHGGWEAGSGSCGNRLALWNVTGDVQGWRNSGTTNGSFAAVAGNESDSYQWKKYRSYQAGDGPLLKIFTGDGPRLPSALQPPSMLPVRGPALTVSARYDHPLGYPGKLGFGLWNGSGVLVWNLWSDWTSSGVQRPATTPALPANAWYELRVAAYDGTNYSDFTPAGHWIFNNTWAPETPTQITPAPNAPVGQSFTASARYADHWGFAGELEFRVVNQAGQLAGTFRSPQPVQYGQIGNVDITNLPVGNYNLYAYSHSAGLFSLLSAPIPITVAAAPGAPASLNASAAPMSALVKWTDGPSNNSPVTRYDFTANNSTNAQLAPVQRACLTACSPTNGFLVDGLVPGHTYTVKATATNVYGTSQLSTASSSVTAESWSRYSVTATTPARGDTSVRVDWTAQALTLKYVVKAYEGARPTDGLAVGTPVSQVDALGGVTTANVGAPNSTPLRNGTPHYFTVTPYFLGILAGPESEASNDVTPAGAPFEPESTLMFPGDQQATVLWTPPESQPNGTPGDNGAPVTNYNVDVYPEGSAEPVRSLTVTPDQTSADVTGLTNGVSYVAKVNAKNDAKPTPGPRSAPSNISRPAGAPFAPVDIDVARADLGSAQVYWSDPPLGPEPTQGDNGARISRYQIVPSPACSACKGLELGGLDNTAIVTGLDPGATYTFKVRAGNRAGDGPLSDSSEPIVPQLLVPPPAGTPDAPSSVFVTLGVASRSISDANKGPAELTAAISWTPAPGPTATSYTIYALGSGLNKTFSSISGSASSFIADGLSGNSSYDFAVVPINGAGVGTGGHSGSVRSLLARMDEYMEMTIPQFQPVWSTRPHPPFMWDSDGCSIGFNVVSEWVNSLDTSCQRHDFGYHNYGHRLGLYMNSQAIRTEVDDNFLRDMRYQCGVNTSSEFNRQACLKASKAAYLTIRVPNTANTYFRE